MKIFYTILFLLVSFSAFAENTTETLAATYFSENKIVPVEIVSYLAVDCKDKSLPYEKYIEYSKRSDIEKKSIILALQKVSFDRKNPIYEENFKLLKKLLLKEK